MICQKPCEQRNMFFCSQRPIPAPQALSALFINSLATYRASVSILIRRNKYNSREILVITRVNENTILPLSANVQKPAYGSISS